MEMKATGAYISRGLSFCAAEFAPMDIMLDEAQEAVFDATAEVWSRLKADLQKAL